MTSRGLLAIVAQWAPAPGPQANQDNLPTDLSGVSLVVMLLFAVSLLLVFRKRWSKRRGYRGSTGGAAVGNALFGVNEVFMPHHANAAVICKLEEEEHQDHAGEGPTPWTPPKRAPEDDPYRDRPPPEGDDGET